jgi:hypothetical protein
VLDGVVAVILFLIASGVFDLNRPWFKRRIQAYVQSSEGLDVDYGSARMSLLHGIVIDDLVVHAAPEDRRFATDLLRAAHVEAHWSTSSLFGRGPHVEAIDMKDVTLTIVLGTESRSPPLSHRPGQLLAKPPLARRLHATRATLALIWTRNDRALAREEIRDFGVAMTAEPRHDGWRVRAAADAPASPRFSLAAELSTSTLTVASDMSLLDQSWHAEASARFEPNANRTLIDVTDVRAAGGVASARAQLEVPDEGEPILRHSEGDLDVAHVLSWLPAGLVPLEAERGRLRYRIDAAILGPSVRFAEGGGFHVEAELSKAKLRAADVVIETDDARLALDGQPSSGSGLAIRGSQRFDGARLSWPSMHIDASDLSIDVDGERARDGALAGRLALRFGRLRESGSRAVVVARDGRCEIHLENGREDGVVSAEMAALDVRAPSVRVLASSVAIESRGLLATRAPYGSELEVSAGAAQIFAGEHRFVTSPARVRINVDDRRDAIDYMLVARVGSAIGLRSKGRLDWSGEPSLQQDTSIDVDHPVFRGASARSLALHVQAHGTLSHHEVTASLHAPGLTVDGMAPTDTTALVSATIDRHPWSLRFEADVDGPAHAKLAAAASFDPDVRAIVFDVDGAASRFAPLSRLASGFDLSKLEVGLAARGALSGVLASVGDDGAIDLEAHPWRTAAIHGSADLRVEKLRWTGRSVALVVPSFVWHGDMRVVEGERRTLGAHAEVASVRLGLGAHQVDLAGLSDDATVTVTGDLRNPTIDVVQRGTIRAVEQDYIAYPVGDMTVALSAGRGRNGLIRVTNLSIHNGWGGTTLDAWGGIDVETKRPHLTMTANISQDLAALSTFPAQFVGRGKVAVAATVESPDLRLFRTHLDVNVDHAQVRVPTLGLEADAIDGDIPITAVFDVHDGAVTLDRKVAPSPFARLGLADRHPLLRYRGNLSIGRLALSHLSIAPFRGSLSIDQNVIALEQLEMGMRGGWLTGDCVLDWNGPRSKLDAHLRASGVRSSHGEPFDGNIALVVGGSDRMIAGRADIVRMGRQHLLDLLNIEDPLHVDEAMNGVRSALKLGHPKRVSVVFDNGFANAHIELGGLAAFVHVPDLRGVPTGPLVDRLVEAVIDEKAAP